MPGSVNIGGLSSGIDWQSTVDQLMQVEQRQITILKNSQTRETVKQNAIQQLNDSLLTLRNTSQSLAKADSFFPYQAGVTSSTASPASSLLNTTLSGSQATPGSHSIIIQQIASTQRNASSAAILNNSANAITSTTEALNLNGSFQLNGSTINIASTDSLQNIVASINSANAGVTASSMKVGTSDFRLILESKATGASGFSISGAALSGSLSGLNLIAGGNQLQAGQDASVLIDGLSITRSSNSISDALDGITIDLIQADPTTTLTLDIGIDNSGIRSKVQNFIDQYNDVTRFINDQFVFNPDTGESGPLAGEAMLTSIQSALSSRVLQSIPGITSDRNSLTMIGVELDEKGQLNINSARFDQWLATDPAAIRDVFSATGSSNNPDITFLNYGFNNPSGTFDLQISQAASAASITGTADLSTGLSSNDSLTLIDNLGRKAVINLTAGQSLTSIADTINSELATTYTEQWTAGNALSAGGNPVTSATKLSDLASAISNGDTISIIGTNRQGIAVNGSFKVIDPATDSMADILNAIQFTYGQQVTASIDATGHIIVTDNSQGDSNLTFAITANNENGGSLDFGTAANVTEGRFSMSLQASANGNALAISSKNVGSSSNFTINQSIDALGMANTPLTGTNIAGTINGESVSGSGNILIGNSGTTDGMSILYTGTATGSVGNVTVNMGIGAMYDGLIDLLANPFTGLLQNSLTASQDIYDSLQAKVDNLNIALEKERDRLTQSFVHMETLVNQFNATGQWLTQQIDQFAKK